MLTIIQILFLITVCISLGYSLLYLIKTKEKNLFTIIILSIGIGISLFVIITAIFDIIKIPIFWPIYLLIISLLAAYFLLFDKNKFLSFFKKLDKKIHLFDFLVLLIFLIHAYIFINASLNQPALENDDPWGIAINTAYVKEHKTYDTNRHEVWKDHRSEPYAQGYHMIMGTLSQISGSISQTLKLFNSIFASLSLLFIYILINLVIKNKTAAFFGAFALFANPSFLSRFIWPEALATSLLILFSYYLFSKEKQTTIIGSIIFASIAIIHQRTLLVAILFFIVAYISKIIIIIKEQNFKKKLLKNTKNTIFNNIFFIGLYGFLISLIYWLPQLLKFGLTELTAMGNRTGFSNPYWSRATINFSDYFVTRSMNDMANPAGIGTAIIIVALIGMIFWFYSKKIDLELKIFLPTLLIMLLFIHQFGRIGPSPIPIITVWKFIAIPVAIFFAYSLINIRRLSFFNRNHVLYYFVISIILIIILINSAYPKYQVTTSSWPIGMIWIGGYETYKPYAYLQETSPGAKLFTTGSTVKAIGLDFRADYINKDHELFKKEIYNKSEIEIYTFLKENNYEYLIVEVEIIRDVGEEKGIELLNQLLNELTDSQRIQFIRNSQTAFLFQVN